MGYNKEKMGLHNNYKSNFTNEFMQKRGRSSAVNKRGQVTLFVIIAVVILVVVLVVLFYPRLVKFLPGQEPVSPYAFLKSCIEDDIKPKVELLSKQGGYLNPEGFLYYQGEKIKYLCYSSEYYKTCVVQQPMIKNHFEQELSMAIDPEARTCVRNLIDEYERQGFNVVSSRINSNIVIEPGKIKIDFEAPMTITKAGEESLTFKNFEVNIDSEMYDLLFIAQSIIEFESTYGNSETTSFIQYYPDLKIEKTKLSDGSAVYVLTNVVTKEQFKFASRSLAWPPGYGLE